ncbi:MAG: S1 RNA-binding domain-containing protein [Tissierellia bacterium]|nr:S1 RNA-binding domain-containing protein [Tissierellia bacterium]
MAIEVGQILEGEVNGVTNFGAFVTLPDDSSGLVHISEISNDYVENINDVIKKGDKVKVKVLSLEKDKIALSMKQANKIKKENYTPKKKTKRKMSFEDQLENFFKESQERTEQLKSRYGNRRNSNRD